MKSPRILYTVMTVGAFAFANSAIQAAPPRLLPFQGRLTDAVGTPVADGAKVVQFKIYDAPTGGTAVWNGEVQKLTVNGGLVSTLLGSKADLSGVDFNKAVFLEITVDANADYQITAADPPLLPRQSIFPAVFAAEALSARDAQKLGGFNWSAVFDNGDPMTGKLSGSRLQTGSLPAAAIAATNQINASQLADNSVGNSEIVDASITSGKIADATVTTAKLVQELIEKLVPPGTILVFAGGSLQAPSGYLFCDGRTVSRTVYSNLFAVIGTTYGQGDGFASYQIPDLRAMFLRGSNEGRADSYSDPESGSRGGIGSYQVDQFRSHTHSLGGSNGNLWANGGGAGFAGGSGRFNPSASLSVNDAGGTETRPKNIAVNYVIKY